MEWFGTKLIMSGDHILPDETAILVINHASQVDWAYIGASLYYACMPYFRAYNCKFITQEKMKHIPGLGELKVLFNLRKLTTVNSNARSTGWIIQMSNSIFLKLRWQDDKMILTRNLHYFQALRLRVLLILFPEGAIFQDKTKKLSNAYAQKIGKPEYQYVLHPKTKGFSHTAMYQLRSNYLDAIYDITLAFHGNAQNV